MNSVIISTKKQKKQLISSLVAAFLNYPLFSEILTDISSRATKLQEWVRLLVNYGYKFASIYSTSKDSEGALILIDSLNHPKETNWKWVLAGALRLFLKWNKNELKKYNHVTTNIEKTRINNAPRDHIYIMLLGVNPDHQKRGHAQQLINQAIIRSQEAHLPLYLETFKPINEGIYHRFGFQTVEKYPIPNSDLTLYSMLRDV